MTAQSNLASDVRRPLTAISFETGGGFALRAFDRAICVVGTKAAAGTAVVEEPVLVSSATDGDTLVGPSTPLALALRKAFDVFARLGNPAQVYVCPVADPGGTAAIHKLTVTGTATAAGELVVRICGRVIRVTVASGDTNATIAAAIVDAINARQLELPGTAAVNGVNAYEVDFTVGVTGVVGNDVVLSEDDTDVAGVTTAWTTPTPGVGTIDVTNALDALGSAHYFSLAIEPHTTDAGDDVEAHLDEMWGRTKKRFRHAFFGVNGSLATATTLAAASNRYDVVVGSMEDAQDLSFEIAVAIGAARLTKEKPSHNWDGTAIPLYGPLAASSVYSEAEVESALAGGATPLTVDDAGNVRLVRLVTTKATEGGAPYEKLRDLSISWTMAYYGLQVDAAFEAAKQGQNATAEFLETLEDVALDVLKRGESRGDLQNVDAHRDLLFAHAHDDIPSRALVEIPQSVVSNAHQIDATVRLLVESPLG